MGHEAKPWEEVRQDTDSLASSLGPILQDVCFPHLSAPEWFKATWRRGGAATGHASWTRHDGRTVDAIIKLPVGPAEHRWTTLLGGIDEEDWAGAESLCTPRVLAAGEMLAGYDLAWLIMERLDGRPLIAQWDKDALVDLIDAVAQVQARAMRAMPVGAGPVRTDWGAIIDDARRAVREQEIEHPQVWGDGLKRVRKRLDDLTAAWNGRPLGTWCHGDLHPANAMRRGEAGPCVLIDLALMHAGHWVEDGVYLERQFWGRPELLFGIDPIQELAQARTRHGLTANGDFRHIADIRRLLAAACAPAFPAQEGHPAHLAACLGVLERLLKAV